MPVPMPWNRPPRPLARPGVPAVSPSPGCRQEQPQGPAEGGGLLRGCPGGPQRPSRVAVQVHGKPRHGREAAALSGAAPLCKGEVSQGGGHGDAGLSPRCGRPGWSWRSELQRAGCPGPCGPGESRLPGVGSRVGAHPGARGSSPGVGQPQERLPTGTAPFSRGCRGCGWRLYRGGMGSPPSRRCISPKARSSCSSWELSGRWISRCMRSVSSHCSSLANDGLSEEGETCQLCWLCPHLVPCPREPWGSLSPTASRGPGRSSRRRWGRSWGGRQGGSSAPGSPGH